MNIIDKAIEIVAPAHAVKRKAARIALNTGYSEGGASHTKNSLRGFTARSSSPVYDIDANLETLRNRTRSLFMTSPISRSAISTIRTNVVGSGLKLKARIDYEAIGINEEKARELEELIEREFSLWASSSKCDALGLNDFYEQQALFLLGQLMNGDGFCLRKYEEPTPYMPYGLRLQLIESDRICTPNVTATALGGGTYIEYGVNPDNGNEIYSGVEIDKNGKTVAYHICNQYPRQQLVGTFTALEWSRIEAYGKDTGLPNILHMFDAERAEQRRGVPILAPVIESLKQITRYTDAELMAAVISGMYTIFIKTDTPQEMPFGEAMPDELEPIDHNENEYELGNGSINMLGRNESIEIADPKRPIAGFNTFVNAMSQQIGSALEIPHELLLKEFNSSYSASRAALLEAWKMFRRRREFLANAFCQPVYEMFMTEAVARGRISAPRFFSDPLIKKAYCGADWNGPAQGMLDPTKEVQAAQLRVQNGFSTREEETIGLTGGNFIKNAKQLKKENEILHDSVSILNPKLSNSSGKGAEKTNGNEPKGIKQRENNSNE